MAELLKNIYNKNFFYKFIETVQLVKADFNKQSFLNQIYDGDWDSKELKQRMRHITIVLKNHLHEDYKKNVNIILKVIPKLIANGFKPDNLEFIFFPDFIEVFGLEEYEVSIDAFPQITQFVTCEFAVRPFIIKYEKEMIKELKTWSKDSHPMVRRLASEGCRPRLPWAIAISFLKENPTSILPILENLKNDESESVRRSVANNLNDISKDHPETVILLAKKWHGITTETDFLIKHACRTLLKQGNIEAMRLFGFGSIDKIKIENFKILSPTVKVGGALNFIFQILNTSSLKSKIRIEYGLYYQKANGSLSRKVFKISEKEYLGETVTEISRKQSFKIITTRKFHKGKHQLSIIINGIELGKLDFILLE